jgi:hypothetical protein
MNQNQQVGDADNDIPLPDIPGWFVGKAATCCCAYSGKLMIRYHAAARGAGMAAQVQDDDALVAQPRFAAVRQWTEDTQLSSRR